MFGPSRYGQIIIAMAIVTTIAQFLDVRTSEGLIKLMGAALVRGEQRHGLAYFYTALMIDGILLIITLGVLLLAAPPAALAYPEGAELAQLVRIFMLSVPFSTLENNFVAILNIHKHFRLIAVGTLVIEFVRLIILVAATAWGLPGIIWGYVAAAAFSFTVWFLLGVRVLRTNLPGWRPAGMRTAIRNFLPFAFHTSLSESFKSLFANASVLILGALRPPAAVSFYKIADSAVKLSALAVTPVRSVLFPNLNEAWERNDRTRIRSLIRAFMAYGALISAGIAVGFLLLGRWLISLIYGSQYLPALPVIYILSIGLIIDNALLWVRPAVMSANRPSLLTLISVFTIVFHLPLVAVFAYLYGAKGAALGNTLSLVAYGLLVVLYIMPTLKLRRRLGAPPLDENQRTGQDTAS